jgi:hypothetical protein
LDTGKLLGIIVIKDSYNVKTDYNKAWNIYVANTIKTINAIIYADGALRSADASWNIYPDSKLLERLELYGSLVSRNTIGWATQAEGTDYLLPGSAKTLDYDLASIYDLNYLRKTPICSADDYAFLIRYNSRVVTNPPKGFSLEQK